VRDLQLVVEVCECFVSSMISRSLTMILVFVDILLEHVKTLEVQDDFYHICECRGYLIDEYDVPEFARGTAAQL
jgi:hypothetical protein